VYYKPSFVRYLQLAGRALNKSGDNYISSKNGKKIYPFTVIDGGTVYSPFSPVSITKQSMPYFYASGQSGINIVGTGAYDGDDRGFEIRVNENRASFFRIASMQTYIKQTNSSFPDTAQTILAIEEGNALIEIKIQSANSAKTRGKIFATRTIGITTTSFSDIKFYINGNISKEPVLNINEWSALGMSFLSPIDFDGSPGTLRFKGNMLFNNISYYQAPPVELSAKVAYRLWNDVSALYWNDWDNGTWNDLLITTAVPDIFGVVPDTVYKSFTGTDRIIADSDVSTTTMMLNNYQYKVFNSYSSDIQFVPAR
jgi:hypothetical protein